MKNSNVSPAETHDNLLNDLRSMVIEAEKMMSTAGEQDGGAVNGLRERFGAAQERVSEMYTGARQKVVAGAKYTDKTIRANPYQSLAVALGVGVLLGVVIGRRNP
jgi:ElaB/YqjD/DUF883 family membrane-anchored ribosome-binding protein